MVWEHIFYKNMMLLEIVHLHLFSTYMANILQFAILSSVLLGISGQTCSRDDSMGAPFTDQVPHHSIDTWCYLQCSIQYQQYGIQRIESTNVSKARCYCGHNTGPLCNGLGCIFLCDPDRQPCGGPDCMSVYPVTDRNYCYEYTQWGLHHSEEIDGGSYNEVCESICRNNGTIYYGLQGTEIPGPVKCYCGNELLPDNKCMSQCSFQCSGSTPCGSGSCMSVYAVSPSSPLTTSAASSTTVAPTTTPITTTTVTFTTTTSSPPPTTTTRRTTTTTESITTVPNTETTSIASSTTTVSTITTTSDETSTADPDGLSPEAIAGISVGVVIFVALVIFLSIFLTRRRKKPALLRDVYVNQGFAELTENAKPPDNKPTPTKVTAASGPTRNILDRQPAVVNKPRTRLSSKYLEGLLKSNEQDLWIPVKELNGYVKSRKVSGDMFKEEYERLPDDTETSCKVAVSDDIIKSKNWFKDIYPFDYNRVVLGVIDEDPLSDYINASHIQGYLPEDKFIAALGPRNATKEDFWRMVWQENVDTIVMVTNLVEVSKVKCERYWPKVAGTVMKLGTVNVRMADEKTTRHYTTRKLLANCEGEQRTVMQYHFTVWPDHGVPPDPLTLINFRRKVSPRIGQGRPVVIHCSAGVGRTGTFIALDSLIKQGEAERQVNVFSFVSRLRLQRRHMIQTVTQYAFLHEALNDYFKIGVTNIDISNGVNMLKSLLLKSGSNANNKMGKQFKMLEDSAPQLKPRDIEEALNNVNSSKNRFINILPMFNRRIFIGCPVEGGNDYINAVAVDSFFKKNAFYVTQIPLENTVSDYWRMIYESGSSTLIVLCSNSHAKEAPHFLPARNKPMPFQESVISVRASSSQHAYRMIELDLISKNDVALMDAAQGAVGQNDSTETEASYMNLEAFIMIKSGVRKLRVYEVILPEDQKLLEPQVAIDIYEEVQNWTPEMKNPVVVCCLDGADFSGQYVACSNLFDMIRAEKEIDLFQIVRYIKQSRPEFIQNFEQYKRLHEAALLYLMKEPDHYYNN